MDWEVVIGLEAHTQLATVSKLFSGASTAFGAPPNSQASVIDLALPGTLPVLNRAAVDCAIRLGLALDAEVAARSIFARKNYFYPDLPKGYQISQYETPVVRGGSLEVQVTPRRGAPYTKVVRLTRAHLEEDAGKSLHESYAAQSGIDLNRAGTPLLEIVSEPAMHSSDEAVAYARALHALVVWLGICDGNMQEGSFRCDANVSVRPAGSQTLGTRVEVKNLNSFRFLQQAIDHEARRQVALIEDGGRVVQETRLYDPNRDETRPMRSKEDAMDYRYFPDPDLLALQIEPEWIAAVRATMPELPAAMRARLVLTHGLPEYDAAVLTATKGIATYYEALVDGLAATPADAGAGPKAAAGWMMGEMAAALNDAQLDIEDAPVTAAQLAQLIGRVADGTINRKTAKEVFNALWAGAGSADNSVDAIIAARGLKQISDPTAIEGLIDAVLAANPGPVAEYRAGKDKAFNSLVGQAMKATKGQANPQQVNEILRRKLG